MANPINFLGRVESDPMRVPTATTMTRQESFDRVLERTQRREAPAEQPGSEPAHDRAEAAPERDDPRTDVAPERRRDDGVEAESEGDAGTTDLHDAQPTDGAVDIHDSFSRGEPVRQETAGKGADSLRTSIAEDEPAPAPTAPRPTTNPLLTTGGGTLQNQGNGPVTARTGEPLVRGAEAIAQTRATAPARTQATQAGYATRSAASAEMLEQARDSVFKQILMKLDDQGGEMRMRLEPPDLGELDLRLVVEGGNKLSLSISAERADVAHLLQRHLDELKQTLQQNGLEVTGAEVQTRSGSGGAWQHGGDGGSGDGARDERAPTARQQFGGWYSAEGLDFWA